MKGAYVCTLALLAGCAVASAAHAGTTTAVAPKDVERLLDSFFKDLMQGVAAENSLPSGKRRSLQTVNERLQVGSGIPRSAPGLPRLASAGGLGPHRPLPILCLPPLTAATPLPATAPTRCPAERAGLLRRHAGRRLAQPGALPVDQLLL